MDDGSPNGINYSSTGNAWGPQLIALGTKLYIAWAENESGFAQIRVVSYDGSSLAFVDGGGPNGINHDPSCSATISVSTVSLAVLGTKLYVAWAEYNASGITQIRVASYDGSTWAFVDGNGANGINYNTAMSATNPQMTVYNSKIYATWTEVNSINISQIRVASYDGSTWAFVDGNGANGINYNTAMNAMASKMTMFNSKLYAIWDEMNSINQQIRVASYDGKSWAFEDGNVATGINKDFTQKAYTPDLAVFGNKLYAAWPEDNASGVRQVRVAVRQQ
jgi:hypothetical protein